MLTNFCKPPVPNADENRLSKQDVVDIVGAFFFLLKLLAGDSFSVKDVSLSVEMRSDSKELVMSDVSRDEVDSLSPVSTDSSLSPLSWPVTSWL